MSISTAQQEEVFEGLNTIKGLTFESVELLSAQGKLWIEERLLRRGVHIEYYPDEDIYYCNLHHKNICLGFDWGKTLPEACFNATVKYLGGEK